MTEKNIKLQKIFNIDFLRVVLIMAIIVHHFYNDITQKWNNGYLAVQFFFIISGFFLVLTLNPQKKFKEFVIGKIIKFLPLMFFTSTVVVLFAGGFNIQKFLSEMFFLPLTGLFNNFGYNHPAWFVAVLFWILIFYFYLLQNFKRPTANIIAFILTFSSLVMGMQFQIPYVSFRLLTGLGAFGIGYFIGTFCQDCSRDSNPRKSILFSILELADLIFLIVLLFSFHRVNGHVAVLFLMGLLVWLFYVKRGYISTWLEKGIWSKLSVYVFPTFLTHFILFSILFNAINVHYHNFIIENKILVCTLGIIASFGFGVLTYYLVQKPCEKLLKNKLLKKE